jgi:alpha/beta superfamily hydrolase
MEADERATTERHVAIERPSRRLEGLLAVPEGTVRAGVVLCHPHPQYGGNMYNGVIRATARAAVGRGFASLRFNFGGTGESEGAYSGGPEEAEDARAAVDTLAATLGMAAPVVLAGYSFGAAVALLAAGRAPRVCHVIAIAPPLGLVPWDPADAPPQPVSIIAAEHDQYCPAAHLDRVTRAHPERIRLAATIAGADHFFSGSEAAVATACCRTLDERVPETGAPS